MAACALVTELIVALHAVIVEADLGKVRPSVNVSDRDQDCDLHLLRHPRLYHTNSPQLLRS